MFLSSFLNVSKPAVAAQETTDKISSMLRDETLQVISSLELNQIATLTFHESSVANGVDLNDAIFETLESALNKPATVTPLTLQKSLVLLKHLLLYGAEKSLSSAIFLGRYVEALQSYNTVLMAQQQSSATSLFYKLKGGGVDKGHPVREAAEQVSKLLSSRQYLLHQRNVHADPNSLVPIGTPQQAAFVSDDVRLYHLKKRMEEQNRILARSNLAKADNGFGSGYTSRDGNNVVGAAHSLDEMMQMAQREKLKFSDDAAAAAALEQQRNEGQAGFSDYQAPSPYFSASNTMDAKFEYQQEADLLDFGDTTNNDTGAPPTTDLVGLHQAGSDLYDAPHTATNSSGNHSAAAVDHTADLLSVMGVNDYITAKSAASSDPFAAAVATNPAPQHYEHDHHTAPSQPTVQKRQDPFSAFDDLLAPTIGHRGTVTSASMPPAPCYGGAHPCGPGQLGYANATGTPSAMPSFASNNISISARHAPVYDHDSSNNSDDNGFIMGGQAGAGLEPMGAAPAAPPPPPPAADQYKW